MALIAFGDIVYIFSASNVRRCTYRDIAVYARSILARSKGWNRLLQFNNLFKFQFNAYHLQ